MASTYVDARFAGGPVVVSGSVFLEAPVVRVAFPGQNPVPLFPAEARALAKELLAYARGAERLTNKEAPGAAGTATGREIQNP